MGQKHGETGLCLEAIGLLDRFSELVVESVNIRQALFQAVVAGDADIGRIERVVQDVDQEKQNIKTAYIEHLRSHRCSLDWWLVRSAAAPSEAEQVKAPDSAKPANGETT